MWLIHSMSFRLLHPDEYEILERSSVDSEETFSLDDADFGSHGAKAGRLLGRTIFSRLIPTSFTRYHRRVTRLPRTQRRCYPRSVPRRACFLLNLFAVVLVVAIILTYFFCPSYTHLPPHYQALRDVVLQSNHPGRGNLRNEKVFIAASLYDRGGSLARGRWARAVLDLIDMIGEDSVFLSIYENDSGEEGEHALRGFGEQVRCNHSIVYEEHFDLSRLPAVVLPDGSKRAKRVAYLAEVRNRALRPLDGGLELRYDRLLYLNDVIFDPLDALQLLFSTNIDHNGVAQYRAACAVDFINAFKFYDTFATRDMHGYSVGFQFFPWFTSAGSGQTRQDVLDEKDAVRVRSCWGGMVAFDAKFFQNSTTPIYSSYRRPAAKRQFSQPPKVPSMRPIKPARFRSESDLFRESSESCLIHADIQEQTTDIDKIEDSGIYMNPFIRTAYDVKSHSWLWTTRRFERLYPIVHDFLNRLLGLPKHGPRRTQVAGQLVDERVWVNNNQSDGAGSFVTMRRTAQKGGFCTCRDLQVVNGDRQEGEEGWESIPVPPE
jgi:Cryptococcal mannosyltransferase 1